MSDEITRENVQKILDRNTASRKDAILDAHERQLRLTINRNHTKRTMSDAQKWALEREKAEERREAWLEARARDRERKEIATLAVRRYICACAVIVLATLLTPFPWYGAMALIPGLAVFPMAYIYRLYVPMGEVKE